MLGGQTPRILAYSPLPYNGRGVSQTCVALMQHYGEEILVSELFTPRVTRSVPDTVALHQTLPWPLRPLPWRLVNGRGHDSLVRAYRKAIDAADPATTIAYFWPEPPLELIQHAKRRGLLLVREMINCCRASAKRILDQAYAELGLEPSHGITDELVKAELEELPAYDYFFASRQVVATLNESGVSSDRVIATSFGWSPERYSAVPVVRSQKFSALFVGKVCIGKGAVQLIRAWLQAKIDGELWLAGTVSDEMQAIVESVRDNQTIKFLGFKNDLASIYKSADCFVFPSFAEGGPQVVYEAAGCGLPVITTPMCMGGLVRDGENGLIVPSGDEDALAAALTRLASDADERRGFGERAASDAWNFTYAKIARDRASRLAEVVGQRSPVESPFGSVVVRAR